MTVHVRRLLHHFGLSGSAQTHSPYLLANLLLAPGAGGDRLAVRLRSPLVLKCPLRPSRRREALGEAVNQCRSTQFVRARTYCLHCVARRRLSVATDVTPALEVDCDDDNSGIDPDDDEISS